MKVDFGGPGLVSQGWMSLSQICCSMCRCQCEWEVKSLLHGAACILLSFPDSLPSGSCIPSVLCCQSTGGKHLYVFNSLWCKRFLKLGKSELYGELESNSVEEISLGVFSLPKQSVLEKLGSNEAVLGCSLLKTRHVFSGHSGWLRNLLVWIAWVLCGQDPRRKPSCKCTEIQGIAVCDLELVTGVFQKGVSWRYFLAAEVGRDLLEPKRSLQVQVWLL